MIKKILLTVYFIFFSNFVFAESMKMIGMKGKSNEVSRTINVKMYDNYFEPKSIKVKNGETIKFVVENKGELVHEYNIATKKMHLKHQPEMMMMMQMGILLPTKLDIKKMKESSKTNHAMSHSHSNSLLLEPNKKGEIIWKFSTNEELEVACNVPGHYQAGMVSKVSIY
jgi:uncharacterized cupredoxin-like copper-binding protein